MLFPSRSSRKDGFLTRTISPLNRRRILKGIGLTTVSTALGAGLVKFAPSMALAAGPSQKGPIFAHKPSGINVLLVHGAFADSSSWLKVIPTLQEAGHHVLAVQLPLTSLEDDIAVVRAALALLSGPTVLVGHSYGGVVISGAGINQPNVISLVYVAAFAPAEGESLQDLLGRFPATALVNHLVPAYPDGFVRVDPLAFPALFAADVDRVQARALATVQKPLAGACLGAKAGPAAWQHLPSWCLVSEDDKMTNPDLERWMAERMGATTRTLDSSHASPISHPYQVAETILEAARVTKKS